MLNRICLVGRMVKDPELRYSGQGTAVCSFTIAVNRAFKKDEADFPNIVCFKGLAENTANYTKKGSLVGIDGRLQTRKYQGNDGKTVYVTEVIADSVQFLEPKGNNTSNHTNTQNKPVNDSQDPFADATPIDDDSMLPF